ncbi:MAG: STAS domain-containing protein, partial [Asticcacaulis sp.]|nr:STAS domain-containing protein [Asticcacaulis sp.]
MPKATIKAHKADFAVQAGEDGVAVLRPKGAWLVTAIEGLAQRLRQALKPYQAVAVDSSELEALDTAGAYMLRLAIGDRLHGDVFEGQDNFARLYGIVADNAP